MNNQSNRLVEKLFDGSIDVVGDIHGDIAALESLFNSLGYDSFGNHPESRRLVFVGDLTDRGPDSPAVVRRVKQLIDSGKAQCVLGNHELNIMLGKPKFENGWYFGKEFKDPKTGNVVPQVLADDTIREEVLDFFKTLPLVLERDDVRVVHACWQPEMVAMVSENSDVVCYYQQHRYNINLGLAIRADLEKWQREQRHQNLNPVKVLTSGLEVRTAQPYEDNDKIRYLERYPWWTDYRDKQLCFFGHYSQPYGESRDQSRAVCVDYGVARRWVPKQPDDNSPDKWRLAAIRYPEMNIVFDNGDQESLDIAV